MKLPVALQSEMYKVLEQFKTHRGCEDGWYACPLSEDYLSRGADEIRKCDCGADDVKELLAKIEKCLREE